MFSYLEDRYNDGERYVLHYVTAREVHNIIKAAEAGHGGDPNDYRDFILPPPAVRSPGNAAGHERPRQRTDGKRGHAALQTGEVRERWARRRDGKECESRC